MYPIILHNAYQYMSSRLCNALISPACLPRAQLGRIVRWYATLTSDLTTAVFWLTESDSGSESINSVYGFLWWKFDYTVWLIYYTSNVLWSMLTERKALPVNSTPGVLTEVPITPWTRDWMFSMSIHFTVYATLHGCARTHSNLNSECE